MAVAKSTRAFRTISEAADELGLQPHVLRFWESKFSQIQPMKRSGGRRLYRPEDIEFLRGIKILLHREKHPIKDVQKLIRIRGAQSVVDLGRSIEHAATPKAVKETDLLPKIKPVALRPASAPMSAPVSEPVVRPGTAEPMLQPAPVPEAAPIPVPAPEAPVAPTVDPNKPALDDALSRLKKLKSRWKEFE